MFEYIQGKYIGERENSLGAYIIIDVSGVGYLIRTTHRTLINLPKKNSDIKAFVSLIHKEDTMSLCGFLTREERDIFEILQSVSGIGVKAALTLLDEFDVSNLISIVIKEDYKELSRAKGIGTKTAQKIVIELHDKLINREKEEEIKQLFNSNSKVVEKEFIQEARNVLLSLGYTKDETDNAIKKSEEKLDKNSNSEDILRIALQYLANN